MNRTQTKELARNQRLMQERKYGRTPSRRYSDLGVGAKVGIGFLAVIAIILFVAICLAFGAFTYGLLVLLIWNVLLHGLFHATTLTFLQAMGIGLGLSLISGMLTRTRVSTNS